MTQKKENVEQEFVFEFYDDDYAESLDDVEAPEITEEYNDVDFEASISYSTAKYVKGK